MAIQQPLPGVHEQPGPHAHEQAQHHPHSALSISPAQNEALKIHNQGTPASPLFSDTYQLLIFVLARDAVSKSSSVHRAELIWDSHLAAAAEEWAHYLASRDAGLQHSTDAERPGQGENLYWTSAGGTLADGSQCWVNERKMYHGEKIGEGNFESYGHYTQVCDS